MKIIDEKYLPFGTCHCGSRGDSFNIYKCNYFACHKCKTYWNIGWNILSSWKDENEKIWEENKIKYGDYTEIESILSDEEKYVCKNETINP